MAMWPFRRRSSRKRSRSGANLSDAEGAPPPRSQTEGAVTRAASKKKQRTHSPNVLRHERRYSFSPGRRDSIRVDKSHVRSERRAQHDYGAVYESDELAWDRTPTLHHKDTKQASRRKRSNRRKREDLDREAEIKALSHFTPVRPATDAWQAGRPINKKDSRRVRTMGAGGQQWDDPISDVSLPLPDSIHSAMSSDSEYGSYKVSALDSLAPRPTLRYTQEQRWRSRPSVVAQSRSPKQTLAERMQLPDETLRAHKRVDDLADDLDARDLRELMERDERRRERKRRHEREKMERRLARRTEKQQREEAEARQAGTPPPENLDRGVFGRELVGLGIGPPSAVVTSSKQRDEEPEEPVRDAEVGIPKKGSDHFHPVDEMVLDEPQPEQEKPQTDAHAPETKRMSESYHRLTPEPEPIRGSVSSIAAPSPHSEQGRSSPPISLLAGMLRSRKTRSKSTLDSDQDRQLSSLSSRIDDDKPHRKASTSSRGGRFSLTAFLRRGGRTLRASNPSSFSNTSREEMQAAAAHARTSSPTHNQALAQAQALAKLQGEDLNLNTDGLTGNYVARKPSSGAPKRTRSRFREDLPEFPISPPDSRVQSPEVEVPPLPSVVEQSPKDIGVTPIPIPRYDTPNSGHRQSPTSMDRTQSVPSPEANLSMSLASIDSEGSWLSGRMASKRASAMRETLARANLEREHFNDSHTNSSQEDLAIADDEYLSRLTPNRATHEPRRSGEGRPSSDEGDFEVEGGMKWGAVGAQPKMVHTHRDTMRSHEGLMDIESEVEDGSISPDSPTADKLADVRRARSINLGKGHVRNFSAGSAKLFEITRRQSGSRSRTPEKRLSAPIHI